MSAHRGCPTCTARRERNRLAVLRPRDVIDPLPLRDAGDLPLLVSWRGDGDALLHGHQRQRRVVRHAAAGVLLRVDTEPWRGGQTEGQLRVSRGSVGSQQTGGTLPFNGQKGLLGSIWGLLLEDSQHPDLMCTSSLFEYPIELCRERASFVKGLSQ